MLKSPRSTKLEYKGIYNLPKLRTKYCKWLQGMREVFHHVQKGYNKVSETSFYRSSRE